MEMVKCVIWSNETAAGFYKVHSYCPRQVIELFIAFNFIDIVPTQLHWDTIHQSSPIESSYTELTFIGQEFSAGDDEPPAQNLCRSLKSEA